MSPRDQQFPLFASLPPEIQLQVWEEACAGPSFHIFDVCLPVGDDGRVARAFNRGREGPLTEHDLQRCLKYGRTAFLDAVDAGAADPSAYAWHASLGRTCLDASSVARRRVPGSPSPSPGSSSPTGKPVDSNTVYLAGPDRRISYDNSTDVLHLRLGCPAGPPDAGPLCPSRRPADVPSRLGTLLDSEWSVDMADALRAARRIALDGADTWTEGTMGPYIVEEAAFLACTLHSDLETLYLVEYCAGRCDGCGGKKLRAADLQARGGQLDRDLHGADEAELSRRPDVVQGVGLTYREVFDLEKLGWDATHPTYVFARFLDDAIRSQQGDGASEAVFQGLRILVAEPDGC